ncbi:MAG: membrane protein insertion efficiency factor YidD [Caldiserica bacterium]|nr:membrane protein insertion efficiency factor YidD [Caldisericota bacterium]
MRRALAAAIKFYQLFVSPLLPKRCRFYPTCSEYAREAILKHGVLRGGYLAARRLLRCGPWHPGGYDPVPELKRPPAAGDGHVPAAGGARRVGRLNRPP